MVGLYAGHDDPVMAGIGLVETDQLIGARRLGGDIARIGLVAEGGEGGTGLFGDEIARGRHLGRGGQGEKGDGQGEGEGLCEHDRLPLCGKCAAGLWQWRERRLRQGSAREGKGRNVT